MKRIMQSTLALAIAMTFSVVTVKAQELEEIIVTATKKEESLQDIAVSVTVIDGELIEKAAVNLYKIWVDMFQTFQYLRMRYQQLQQ